MEGRILSIMVDVIYVLTNVILQNVTLVFSMFVLDVNGNLRVNINSI